jgi:hypothetical protein
MIDPQGGYRSREIVRCPLCDQLHASSAERCEDCGQPLHEALDFERLRDEHDARRRNVGLAVAAFVAMIAINFGLFGGGGFFIALAPLSWLAWNWRRWRALRAGLLRHHALGARGSTGDQSPRR